MWFFLAACHAPPVEGDGGDGVEHLTSVTPETAPDTRTSADLFTADRIHSVDITLDDEAWDGLYNDPYTFVSGDVRIDEERMPASGVRLRGKYGSFRTITGKPKFKIEFDEYDAEQRYLGLKAIALNNEVVDCSYLKEPLGYEVFRAAGVPVPRTSFANVSVNGDAYGLYVVVEVPDDTFLERSYPDPTGNLYDGKYLYFPGYGYGYTLLDFASSIDDLFPLEEGVEVGNADITAVSTAILDGRGTDHYEDVVSPVVDLPAFHRFEAAEQWIGHVDGYALNQNNYRVYFNPSTGKVEFIPWDLDYAFIEDSAWGMSWANPRGTLAASCWADGGCRADQRTAVDDLVATLDVDALTASFEAWDTLTLETAQADPRKECATSQVRRVRNDLRDWMAGRGASVTASWE